DPAGSGLDGLGSGPDVHFVARTALREHLGLRQDGLERVVDLVAEHAAEPVEQAAQASAGGHSRGFLRYLQRLAVVGHAVHRRVVTVDRLREPVVSWPTQGQATLPLVSSRSRVVVCGAAGRTRSASASTSRVSRAIGAPNGQPTVRQRTWSGSSRSTTTLASPSGRGATCQASEASPARRGRNRRPMGSCTAGPRVREESWPTGWPRGVRPGWPPLRVTG